MTLMLYHRTENECECFQLSKSDKPFLWRVYTILNKANFTLNNDIEL